MSKTSIYTSPTVVLQSTVKDAFGSTISRHFSRVFGLRPNNCALKQIHACNGLYRDDYLLINFLPHLSPYHIYYYIYYYLYILLLLLLLFIIIIIIIIYIYIN